LIRQKALALQDTSTLPYNFWLRFLSHCFKFRRVIRIQNSVRFCPPPPPHTTEPSQSALKLLIR
jgi:hypothetical protein